MALRYLPIRLEKPKTPKADAEHTPWTINDPYRYAFEKTGDPWEQCLNVLNKYDDEQCQGWKEDIDTLLVFAGLFSAVVTAFTIESYQWLEEDPNDVSARMLSQIALLIASPNATAGTEPAEEFTADFLSIRINIFWFLSLTLSLSTGLIGLLCKQWMREYRREVETIHMEAFALRQLRAQSWEKWGVPGIIAALPVLLEVALVLFFGGLLDLLWDRNPTVGAFITAVVSLSMVVVVATTVLPSFYYLFRFKFRGLYSRDCNNLFPCSYKSPQAWGVFRLLTWIAQMIVPTEVIMHPDWITTELDVLRDARNPSPIYIPESARWSRHDYLMRGMRWMVDHFGDSLQTSKILFHCFEDVAPAYGANQWCGPLIQYASRRQVDPPTLKYDRKMLRYLRGDHQTALFDAELYLRELNYKLELETPPLEALDGLDNFMQYDQTMFPSDMCVQFVLSGRKVVRRGLFIGIPPSFFVWMHDMKRRSLTGRGGGGGGGGGSGAGELNSYTEADEDKFTGELFEDALHGLASNPANYLLDLVEAVIYALDTPYSPGLLRLLRSPCFRQFLLELDSEARSFPRYAADLWAQAKRRCEESGEIPEGFFGGAALNEETESLRAQKEQLFMGASQNADGLNHYA